MTAKISGLHIRYDVATKCEIVGTILAKTYQSKPEIVATIKEHAAKLRVNYITVRTWIAMYGDCYHLGIQLPKGVMSHSFTTLNTQTDIAKAHKELAKIRYTIEGLKLVREKSNHPKYARPKTKQTSTQILSGLFTDLDTK